MNIVARPIAAALLATFTALSAAACAPGGDDGAHATSALEARGDTLQTELDRIVETTQKELGVPGVRADVIVGDRLRYTARAGLGDFVAKTPIGEHDHVRIGSVTKTFTVTTLLRMADAGVVSLDDHVSRWVPGVPNGEAITLRMLANMTSGLGSYTFSPTFQKPFFADPQRAWQPWDLVAIGAGETRAGCPSTKGAGCFAPGTGFFYSNTNTVVLALALEAAGKRPYADLVRDYVFVPYGLHETSIPKGTELPKPFVRGVSTQGRDDGAPPYEATFSSPSWAFGVGDVVSTPADLARWARALGTGERLSAKAKAERFTKLTMPPNTPERAYAMGIGYENGFWGHTGELPGYNTSIQYRPDIDAVVVVTTNRDAIEVPGKDKPVDPATVAAQKIVSALNREYPLPK
ncbi:MAG: beta-lactamase family protein [Myxococcales bacterium]|nr:beta-lactamase family protein [Myxococcales bacterium]